MHTCIIRVYNIEIGSILGIIKCISISLENIEKPTSRGRLNLQIRHHNMLIRQGQDGAGSMWLGVGVGCWGRGGVGC